ncbi:IS21 family transposase, partial [Dankookia rubra]
RPKLDPLLPVIDRILEEDQGRPRKQRHTARRIFERLIDPAWAVLKASRIRPGWGHEACGHAQAAGGGARGTS